MEHTHPLLLELVPDRLWHAQQLLKFGPIRLATRMSILRLADSSLWVHSPIAPHADLVAQIAALGTVRHVVAPNKSHHLFFLPFLQAFPGAQGWVAPGLGTKRPDLASFPELDANSPWAQELIPYFIEGIPLLNETVWFHPETGTLVMTDLLFCIGPNPSWLVRTAARLLGIQDQPAMSRTMKMAIRDRAVLAASVVPLLTLAVQRIVLAHDAIVTDGAQEKLQHAFEFLQGA